MDALLTKQEKEMNKLNRFRVCVVVAIIGLALVGWYIETTTALPVVEKYGLPIVPSMIGYNLLVIAGAAAVTRWWLRLLGVKAPMKFVAANFAKTAAYLVRGEVQRR